MDFDLIVFLLIFLFPLFQRLFGKKQPQRSKKPKRVPVESTSERVEDRTVEDPLGEALRQIREALGEQTEQQPRPLPEDPKPVIAKRIDEFREVGEFEHEAHGFGRENPISEEVFEQRPAFQARIETRPSRSKTKPIRQKALGDVDLSTPLEVKTAPDASRSDLTRRLRRPSSARDAFVLKEVLDAPRSRRPLR